MKGCKDCPAFSKCIETYRGSGCAALRGTYGLDSDPEIITNADRIRAMSDEELAEFLEDLDFCYSYCPQGMARSPYTPDCSQTCEKELLSWLQQPEEEDRL